MTVVMLLILVMQDNPPHASPVYTQQNVSTVLCHILGITEGMWVDTAHTLTFFQFLGGKVANLQDARRMRIYQQMPVGFAGIPAHHS